MKMIEIKPEKKAKRVKSLDSDKDLEKKVKKAKLDNAVEDKKIKKPFAKKFPEKSNEKTDWNKLKKEKKDLKEKRRKNKAKDLYDIDVNAKKLYEELKMKSTKNKDHLCEELHKLLKDVDYSRLSSSPDRARIIQMMLKKAPNNIKIEIAMKLIPHISEISMSKYGKFCVSRLMVYCGKEMREKAINGMLSKIVKLTSHKFSSALIDMIFLNYASNEQKNFMKQELYSDLYKKDKNKSVKSLKDTWAESDVMKKGIINSTKMNLIKFASKNLVDNSLVHAVLLEFIEETEELERHEVIQAYIPHLSAIASTKQGSRAAVLCYLYSVAKERRAMLKGIKEHLTKLCVHEHGHLLILAILNSTDDTINIKKTLFSHFISNIEEIVSSEYGKRIIFFIVSPSTEFIHPKILESLSNDLKLGTQKKDLATRRKELVDSIEKDLCTCIKNNANFWLKGGHIAQVTVSILQNMDKSEEIRSEVFDSICSIICDINWIVDENESNAVAESKKEEEVTSGKIKKRKNPLETVAEPEERKTISGIEHSGLHIAIKKIAKLPDFAKSFILHLNEDTLQAWIPINRACFVLTEVLENADETYKVEMKALLNKFKKSIEKQTHAGSKVLLKKI